VTNYKVTYTPIICIQYIVTHVLEQVSVPSSRAKQFEKCWCLEKIICDANISQRGNIFYKSVQILAYADDIDIISRSPKSLQEATVALDRAARRMGLEINQAKTKYMICGTKKKYVENIFKVKHMTFERVSSFVY
jgi:hypothetical protein